VGQKLELLKHSGINQINLGAAKAAAVYN